MPPNILIPAAVLVVWTLVMAVWMMATRAPPLRKLESGKLKVGARGPDVEPMLDDRINWVAHNYNHLHEQPTVFYAAVMILLLAGYGLTDVLLAWGYVAVRVAHSVWQATVNRQPARAMLFALSSLFLIGLGLRALFATLA